MHSSLLVIVFSYSDINLKIQNINLKIQNHIKTKQPTAHISNIDSITLAIASKNINNNKEIAMIAVIIPARILYIFVNLSLVFIFSLQNNT